jgi:hypothetical protein
MMSNDRDAAADRMETIVIELRLLVERSVEVWMDLHEAVLRLAEERRPKGERRRPRKNPDRKAKKKTEQSRLRKRNQRARIKGAASRTGCAAHPVERSPRCVTCHAAVTNPLTTPTKKLSKKKQREELKELLGMNGRRLPKRPKWLMYSKNEGIVDPSLTEEEKRRVFDLAWSGLPKKDEEQKESCFGMFQRTAVNGEMLSLFGEALRRYHEVNQKQPDQYKTSARKFFSGWYGGVTLKSSSAGSPAGVIEGSSEAVRFLRGLG